MKFQEIFKIYKNDNKKFLEIIKDLDKTTEFILFQPFKDVFSYLMRNPKNFTYFVEKVVIDLEKKKSDINSRDYYFGLFKENVNHFVKYFSV
jgi:hypothetical protein